MKLFNFMPTVHVTRNILSSLDNHAYFKEYQILSVFQSNILHH